MCSLLLEPPIKLPPPIKISNSKYLSFLRHFCFQISTHSQVVLVVKNLPANAGDSRDMSSVPGLGRSPRVRNGNPFPYSCLENPTDRGA